MNLLLEQAIRSESGQVLMRTKLRAVSRRMGFSDTVRERIEIVYNEMVGNIIKFANGSGLVQIWEPPTFSPALDIFALDYGPGIPKLADALADGFTTSGTLGKGLGTIKRLAHDCEFYSLPTGLVPDTAWHGMAVWARFYSDEASNHQYLQPGAYIRAYHDDSFNGDFLSMNNKGPVLRWLHMDALGHGREAAESLRGAGEFLDGETPLLELINSLDKHLQDERGAVGMVCEVNAATQTLAYTGVGDMYACLISRGQKQALQFPPGILGQQHRRFEMFSLPFPPQALMLTASDGMRLNWTLSSFPDLWRLHPQMIALLLGHVLARGNDDKSMFAIRKNLNRGV